MNVTQPHMNLGRKGHSRDDLVLALLRAGQLVQDHAFLQTSGFDRAKGIE